MGIFIKNMTLDELNNCIMAGAYIEEKDVVEVAKPHGDLIDRAVLQNRVAEEYHAWADDYDAEQILGDIEDADAVIEGEPYPDWIKRQTSFINEIGRMAGVGKSEEER